MQHSIWQDNDELRGGGGGWGWVLPMVAFMGRPRLRGLPFLSFSAFVVIFFKPMCNKTVIRFSFCSILGAVCHSSRKKRRRKFSRTDQRAPGTSSKFSNRSRKIHIYPCVMLHHAISKQLGTRLQSCKIRYFCRSSKTKRVVSLWQSGKTVKRSSNLYLCKSD